MQHKTGYLLILFAKEILFDVGFDFTYQISNWEQTADYINECWYLQFLDFIHDTWIKVVDDFVLLKLLYIKIKDKFVMFHFVQCFQGNQLCKEGRIFTAVVTEETISLLDIHISISELLAYIPCWTQDILNKVSQMSYIVASKWSTDRLEGERKWVKHSPFSIIPRIVKLQLKFFQQHKWVNMYQNLIYSQYFWYQQLQKLYFFSFFFHWKLEISKNMFLCTHFNNQ